MYILRIDKEGFGKDNTNRPVLVKTEKYNTLEEAIFHAKAHASYYFNELIKGGYESLIYGLKVIPENNDEIGSYEIRVDLENNHVTETEITNKPGDYSDEELNLGANKERKITREGEVLTPKEMEKSDNYMKTKYNIGDSVKFKDGRTGIVEDYDSLCYFVRDNYGNVCRIKKNKNVNDVNPFEEFARDYCKLYEEYHSEETDDMGGYEVLYEEVYSHLYKIFNKEVPSTDINQYIEVLNNILKDNPEENRAKDLLNSLKKILTNDSVLLVSTQENKVSDNGDSKKVEDGISVFTSEGNIDGIIENTSAEKMFENARDSQAIALYISKNKKYLAMLQVEGYWMADTEDWAYDEEDGYEVTFTITKASDKLDLNNIEVLDSSLLYESKGIVPEDQAIEGISEVLDKFKVFTAEPDVEDSKSIKDSNVSINFDGKNWIVNDNVNGVIYKFLNMDDAVEKVEDLMFEISNSR